jgi:hypothetical protein
MEEGYLLEWLEDLSICFEELSEGELSPRREGIDHQIRLTAKEPKALPLISIKPEDQQFIREYLDEQLRKNYIRVSKSPAGASLFLVSKKGGKRSVVDY